MVEYKTTPLRKKASPILQLSYDPLWKTLDDHGLHHVDLIRQGIITSAALKKLERDEPISLKVVGQLCEGLGVRVEQVIEFKAV